MVSRSWEFLDSLSKSEIELLSSAIELSGLPDYNIAEGLYMFIRDLIAITGCKDYSSILHWCIGDNRDKSKSLDNLEGEYLSQIYKPIEYIEGKNQSNIIQKAFCILDLHGLYWSQELLDEIYFGIIGSTKGRYGLYDFNKFYLSTGYRACSRSIVGLGQTVGKDGTD